jgi:hypothetical protein
MSTRARDFYEEEHEFQEVLDAAEENAKTDGEVKFVDDLIIKAAEYGGATFLSESQNDWLRQIAKVDD